MNRIMIAGTNSGCGKTTITCGILSALKKKNINTISFKCGPDYIDTMFHKQVLGIPSYNLDIFMQGENTAKFLFNEYSSSFDLAVIEGVMGFYDGLGGNSDFSSSNHVSRITGTPVILVVDCKGMSISSAAVAKGFKEFQNNNIIGFILNNVSHHMYSAYSDSFSKIGLELFGYFPKMKDINFSSRHLGLVTPDSIEDINKKIDLICDEILNTVDMDKIISVSNKCSNFYYEKIDVNFIKKIKIAVAYDEAFCFYYEDNLKLLKKFGADIIYFSPIHDKYLPDNIDAVYLGGGYPEIYAEQLSLNTSMLDDIKQKHLNGLFIFAECGGFMYLHEYMCGKKMTGIFNASCFMTEKLNRFGYVKLIPDENNIYWNECINAHEFHYSDSSDCGNDFSAVKANGKRWSCIFADKNIFAGYPHINLWGNLKFAENLFKLICGGNK